MLSPIMWIQGCVIVSIFIFETKVIASQLQSLPKPENVSITCDSYNVEVGWQYEDLKDVSFKVELKDMNGNESFKTAKRSVNLSEKLKNSAFNTYVVYVTAVRGKMMSEKSVSDVFTFNTHATSKIKCQLDFPSVSSSPKDGQLYLEFDNPLYLYRNSPALRNNTNIFKFTATTQEKNTTTEYCGLEDKKCKTSIGFAEVRNKYCLNLTGEIGQRVLKDKEVCFEGDLKTYPHFTMYLYPVLGVVGSFIFIAAVIILLRKRCNEKIKKEAASAISRFWDVKPTQTHLCKPLNVEPENVTSDLQILPDLASDKDHTKLEKLIEISDDEDKPLDCQNSSVDSEHNDKNAEDYDLDEADDEEHKTGFKDVSSAGLSSGYDCPHVLKVEMSPGDEVEGYRS